MTDLIYFSYKNRFAVYENKKIKKSSNIIINWKNIWKSNCMAIVLLENLEHSFLKALHSSVFSSRSLPLLRTNLCPESKNVNSSSIVVSKSYQFFLWEMKISSFKKSGTCIFYHIHKFNVVSGSQKTRWLKIEQG